jgi:hypothetical protein
MGPVFPSAKPDDGATLMIGRQKAAQVTDQEVDNAVGIDVGRLDARRIRQPRDFHERRLLLVRPGLVDDAVAHVAQYHLVPSVPIEIHQPDARDGVVGRTACGGEHALPERQRPIRGGPCCGPGQLLGRVRFEVRHDRLPLRGEPYHARRRSRGPARFRLVVLDQEHPGDFIAPVASRQHVRRRELVALRAVDTRGGFAVGGLSSSGRRRRLDGQPGAPLGRGYLPADLRQPRPRGDEPQQREHSQSSQND